MSMVFGKNNDLLTSYCAIIMILLLWSDFYMNYMVILDK